jgi:DNA-binding FadR family transcriptional regulator
MPEPVDHPTPNARLARLAQVGLGAVARASRRSGDGPQNESAPAPGVPKSPDPLDEGDKNQYSPINPINRTEMLRDRVSPQISEFMRYLAAHPEADNSFPPLSDLSRELGISLAALREQLEVARALGLVDVKPRTGTRRRPFSFTPAVRQSLTYALALSDRHFDKFAELRNHVEIGFWDEAVRKLTSDDKAELQTLISSARQKLKASPVQVPHAEHRALHLLIFRRLDNPFVTGLLEAYWDMYEIVGLNLYSGDIAYLNEVWDYHARMVECICSGEYAAGREALVAHVNLLMQRPGDGAVRVAQREGER